MGNKQQKAGVEIAFPPTGIRAPETHRRHDRDYFLDEFAASGKCFRQAGPEEAVRQKFVQFLLRDVGVPTDMLKTEDAIMHYAPSRRGRADIVGFAPKEPQSADMACTPLFVVECKEPSTELDDGVLKQALRYAAALKCRLVITTNGRGVRAYRVRRGKPQPLAAMPSYADMLGKEVRLRPAPPPWTRPARSKLKRMSKREIPLDERLGDCLGSSTTGDAAQLALELAALLFDESTESKPWRKRGHVFSPRGLGHVTPRNPSGGSWHGMYRHWLVRPDEGGADARLVSVSVMASSKGKSMLLTALDQDDRTANRLQLELDRFVVVKGHKARVFHNGRLNGGLLGGTNQAMIEWLQHQAPHLLDDVGRVHLGVLPMDRGMKWSDVRPLVVRCAEYALARDAFKRHLAG